MDGEILKVDESIVGSYAYNLGAKDNPWKWVYCVFINANRVTTLETFTCVLKS
jgi:hypothetical protein